MNAKGCAEAPVVISSIDEAWQETNQGELEFAYSSVVAIQGDNVYHGNIRARKTEIDEKTARQQLTLVPREEIYPLYNASLTRAPELHVKSPQLAIYSPDHKGKVAALLLHEAEIYEILQKHPHPALGRYVGCVVSSDNRITALKLVKYQSTLFEKAYDPHFFQDDRPRLCMEAVKAGVRHLHQLGLAHNDITPLNIMFDDDGHAVLLDFDTCYAPGVDLTKGGEVGGWEGIPDETYKQSSFECDEKALACVEKWLKKQQEDVTGAPIEAAEAQL